MTKQATEYLYYSVIGRDSVIKEIRLPANEGEWTDRPSGEGLFANIYNPIIHVRPLNEDAIPHQFEWLLPAKGQPMIIGLDPGAAHSPFVFEQWLSIEEQMKWVIFDEIGPAKNRISYELLIPIVMRRIKFWRDATNSTAAELPQVWISDNSAFNQFRAAQGSFDVLDMEKIYEANRARYGLEPMKIKAAPKFNGSRLTRVRLTQAALSSNQIIVSSRCKDVQKMFLKIQGKKQKPGELPDPEAAMTPAPSDPNRHIFDALSYPILTASLNPTALTPNNSSSGLIGAAA